MLTVLAQAHVERAVRRALARERRPLGQGRRGGRRRRAGVRRAVAAVRGRAVTLVDGLVFRVAESAVVWTEPVRLHSSFGHDFLLEAVHPDREHALVLYFLFVRFHLRNELRTSGVGTGGGGEGQRSNCPEVPNSYVARYAPPLVCFSTANNNLRVQNSGCTRHC